MTLTDMRALVRTDLKDVTPGSYRWLDTDIDRAIQRAVQEFSRHLPDPQKSTIATVAASADIDISTLTSRVSVDKVEFPVGETPKLFAKFKVYQDTLTLEDTEGDGTNCYIYWGKLHTLAATSTIQAQHEYLIALGACAYALESYADHTLAEKVQLALEAAKTELDKVSGQVTDAETALTTAAAVDSAIQTELTNAAAVATDIATQIASAVAELALAGNAADDAIKTGAGSIDEATSNEITSAKARITEAVANLTSGNTALGNIATPISNANTAIGNISARITQAITDLTTGDDLINTVNVGGDVARAWAEYAQREVENALGYNRQGDGYLHVAEDYVKQADGYFTEATRNLDGASGYFAAAGLLLGKRNAYIDASGRYTQEAQGFLTAASELNNKRLAYLQAASELNKKRLGYLDAARQYITSTYSFIQEAGQHQRDAGQYQDNSKLLASQAKTKLAKFLNELKPISIQRRLKFTSLTSEE